MYKRLNGIALRMMKTKAMFDMCVLIVLQRVIPRCCQLHANRQLGAEETGVPLPYELRQDPARHRNIGSQYFCQGL